MQDIVVFIGAIALVVALSEAHLRISANVGKSLLLVCSAWLLTKGRPEKSTAKTLKLWSAMLGIAFLIFDMKNLFSAVLLMNVVMISIPPLYRGDLPLALGSLWLASLTPTGNLDSQATYMWCYFAVLFSYYLLSAVTREHAVSLVVSIIPMAIGLLVHSKEGRAGSAAAVYRCVGMLVAFVLPEIWYICTALPATRFSLEVDGSECTKGSFADMVDHVRYNWAFRFGCYAVCAALLTRASVEALVRARDAEHSRAVV